MMILADKIMTLRKRSGWSQDELAEKMNVSRQSVSKWESAQSIPDINKILELARIFGVTTDYLLRDEQEDATYTGSDESPVRMVTLEEATALLDDVAAQGKRTAFGVLLCILAPVALIFLAAYSETGLLTEGFAIGLGLVILFLLAAVAVAIFIISSVRENSFNKLKRQPFELSYGVPGVVKERRDHFMPVYTTKLVAGVSLCILSVIPLIVAGLMGASDFVCILFTCLLLGLVGIGVYLLVSTCTKKEGFDLLLKDGEYDPATKEETMRSDRFSGFFWPILVAVYLAVSFLTSRWDITWVIWPVGTLIYVGISAALKGND